MKTIILIILGISLQVHLLGQSNFAFVFDKEASSIANAENLVSLHRIIYEFENKHIKPKYWDESSWKGKTLGIGYRFTKTVLIDYQIDFLTHLYQHEVFGHGYRFREFEYKRNSYHINLLPPYGSGGGYARRGETDYARQLGVHERIVINSGGMEAAAILSNSIRKKWLINGEINYRESLLFLSTIHDYTQYILGTKFNDNLSDGNDVNNYLRTVNVSYGFLNEDAYKLSLDDLAIRSSVNFLNTYQFFALYAYYKVYLFDGDEVFKYPMIELGKVNWLPSIRFGLTPFGSELIIENYFKTENKIVGVSFRKGDGKLDNYWGGGLTTYTKFGDHFQFSSYVDFWIQPSLELGGIETFRTKEGLGGRLIGEFNWQINNSFPIGLYSQIGYKSTGFIEGERLDKGLIFRIGAQLKVNEKSDSLPNQN